ncbi:serine/threonine-protein kinase [Dolichospermum sp. UHCC 0684]|uniref:serine/threonine-protein kinase n=1 Tax=unclassified Dolichospermum TaxID=2622029 RepID=UPI002B212808|nr:serine/threonine-protein kinase [Dolichospermum sp. UHCC 0684]MEA5530259.1 serine/threonine-protein kinase [Dolichospermum sp. UHCC 0684]
MWTPHQSINDGKYIIQNVLGEGGFGITYSAIEQSTGELVAIKTLNGKRQRAKDFPKQQERFVNEAFNLRAFSHPHIVKVYKMIQEDGLWGMVMEFIDGVDLNDYVDENGQLSEDDALLYIDQIGQALEYIHQQDGMIHRDIKPHNMVLRRGKKEAVLVDFGLACNIDKFTTRDGRTPGYAPPEQYTPGEQLGFYTDVYALATTLYYLLTADGLKDKDEYIHESIIRKYGALPLEPPQYYNSRISKRVNDAIIKGMELEVENRPQTVGEFRELLGLLIPPILEVLDEMSLDQAVELKSAVGIDYTQLRNLLAARKWKEADEETARIMLSVAKREEEDWLDAEDIHNFPCEDLHTIDQLWVKYSNGRFGFSVQQRIYQSMGGTRKFNPSVLDAFGDTVGWRKEGNWLYYKNITFDETAPEAFLPTLGKGREYRGILGVQEAVVRILAMVIAGFYSRVETCYLPDSKSDIQNPKLASVVSLESLEISAVGMDYRKLRNLLAARKWEEADEETARVMLSVAKQQESLRVKEDIDNFPCEDLRTIDYLWVKYSNGRFGFSVQKRIYENLGGTRKYDEKIKDAFGDTVGWRKGGSWLDSSSETIFDIKAPEGHLPVLGMVAGGGSGGVGEGRKLDWWGCLLSRFDTCGTPNTKSQSEIKHLKLSQLDDVELISDMGMNYSKLRDFLATGKWKQADEETKKVMLAVAKRTKEGWLDVESIDKFPCQDLQTIDQLWLEYSNGRFGFSVQNRIYENLGSRLNLQDWDKFGQTVGWKKNKEKESSWLLYKDITFDIKAPEGHLPVGHLSEIKVLMMGKWEVIYEAGGSSFGMGLWAWFFSRVETCNL